MDEIIIRKMYKIGWFSSGRDEAARSLLKVVYDNIRKGKLPNLGISFIFSDRVEGENKESDSFLSLVEELGIHLVSFSSRGFKPEMRKKGLKAKDAGDVELIEDWRNLYHKEVAKRIDEFGVDFITLAGYMLIIGKDLCQKYPMINLHPARPGGPKGTWQEVIWELIRQRAKATGVMMHLVTPELDAGPPLTYVTFSIRGGKFNPLWENIEKKLGRKTLEEIKKEEKEKEPLFKEIRKEGVRRELPLIVHTLKTISEEKIRIKEVMRGARAINAYCLNKEIENETG